MIVATIELPTLRCHEQWDGNGLSEPYLWTAFFWADISTIGTSLKVRVTVPLSSQTLRDRFPNAVQNGQDIIIPPEVGRLSVRLDDGGSNKVMLGALVVLLEQDDTPDNAIKRGHDAFRQSVDFQLNKYVDEHIDELMVRIPTFEELEAIASAIQKATTSAIKSQLSLAQKLFGNQDDFLGYTFALLLGSQVTNPNGNNLVFPLIEKDEFQPGNFGQPVQVGHQSYEIIGGRITVEPFVPDPCASQVLAFNRARTAVEQIQQRISRLQEQLRDASFTEKQDLLNEIREIRATELPPALDAVQLAQEQLTACRNAN